MVELLVIKVRWEFAGLMAMVELPAQRQCWASVH